VQRNPVLSTRFTASINALLIQVLAQLELQQHQMQLLTAAEQYLDQAMLKHLPPAVASIASALDTLVSCHLQNVPGPVLHGH
jgi:uncharacterized protein YyaL (SSP411 family)